MPPPPRPRTTAQESASAPGVRRAARREQGRILGRTGDQRRAAEAPRVPVELAGRGETATRSSERPLGVAEGLGTVRASAASSRQGAAWRGPEALRGGRPLSLRVRRLVRRIHPPNTHRDTGDGIGRVQQRGTRAVSDAEPRMRLERTEGRRATRVDTVEPL